MVCFANNKNITVSSYSTVKIVMRDINLNSCLYLCSTGYFWKMGYGGNTKF